VSHRVTINYKNLSCERRFAYCIVSFSLYIIFCVCLNIRTTDRYILLTFLLSIVWDQEDSGKRWFPQAGGRFTRAVSTSVMYGWSMMDTLLSEPLNPLPCALGYAPLICWIQARQTQVSH